MFGHVHLVSQRSLDNDFWLGCTFKYLQEKNENYEIIQIYEYVCMYDCLLNYTHIFENIMKEHNISKHDRSLH